MNNEMTDDHERPIPCFAVRGNLLLSTSGGPHSFFTIGLTQVKGPVFFFLVIRQREN